MVACPNQRPLLLGHRGCRLRQFDENSIVAFEHALASGCNGFELDVRITGDYKLVCVHDESVRRSLVETSDYEVLCKLYLKSCRDKTSSGIVALEEVLQRFSNRAFLNIELKVAGMEPAVSELLRGSNPERLVVSSFLPEVLRRISEIAPTIPLGLISRKLNLLQEWRNLPVHYVIPRHDIVSREMIAAVHGAGRKLLTWTVNSKKEMLQLSEWGVDGLISDDPVLLSETLGSRH